MSKNTYGTGSFLLLNTGTDAPESEHGLLTSIGWRIGGQCTYVLEGAIFVTGAAVQWLRDGLGIVETAAETEALAAEVPPGNEGVYLVPAFVGLGRAALGPVRPRHARRADPRDGAGPPRPRRASRRWPTSRWTWPT